MRGRTLSPRKDRVHCRGARRDRDAPSCSRVWWSPASALASLSAPSFAVAPAGDIEPNDDASDATPVTDAFDLSGDLQDSPDVYLWTLTADAATSDWDLGSLGPLGDCDDADPPDTRWAAADLGRGHGRRPGGPVRPQAAGRPVPRQRRSGGQRSAALHVDRQPSRSRPTAATRSRTTMRHMRSCSTLHTSWLADASRATAMWTSTRSRSIPPSRRPSSTCVSSRTHPWTGSCASPTPAAPRSSAVRAMVR